MTRITLVRHGETFQNRHHVVQGQDPTWGRLTPRGIRQATLLGKALAEEKFDRVYCSSLERAVLTMSLILVERPGDRTLPIVFADELREINLGVLHGRPHADWKASISGDPMTFHPDGGESWLDVQSRATDYLNDVILANGAKNILMVAHGGVNRGVISSLTGISMAQSWNGPGDGAPQDNTCVNNFELDTQGQLVSAEVNITSHLDDEEGECRPHQRWIVAENKWEILGDYDKTTNVESFIAAP